MSASGIGATISNRAALFAAATSSKPGGNHLRCLPQDASFFVFLIPD